MNYLSTLLITLVALSSLQCKKNKPSELEMLPPVTQTGAGTFGCLINGKAFLPQGYTGNVPNFSSVSDISFNGNLHIKAYKYVNQTKESISIFCYDVTSANNYLINGNTRIWVNYRNEGTECIFLQGNGNFVSGFLKITRYDLQSGIIAGEFECKLFDAASSCDTIRITNGRFDYKL